MDWYRWWHGSVTDPKLHMIAHECECTRAEIIGVWAILLEYASANDPRGSIGQSSLEAISYLSELAGFDKICNAMKRIGLLHDENGDLFVSNWEKRQPNRERFDDSKERVRAYRERKKANETHDNAIVTPGNATREDKRRVEKEEIPPNGKKTARGSRLPAEWKLPKTWGEWAISERPTWSPEEVRQCSLRFADFWHAKAGKDATKLDWLATWRNWVRNDRGGSPDRKPTSGSDWTPPLMPAGPQQ